jgi:Tfp pilus assembly ATPase PilU
MDGDTEGMQHFDGEIEKLVRAGTVDLETGLAYATNPGNLRLQLTHLGEGESYKAPVSPRAEKAKREPGLEIEVER